MTEFKIKRGLSTQLFLESGVVNPKLIIEESCWYLCIDTADIFLGVKTVDESTQAATYELKRINSSIADIVEMLSERVATVEDIELFKKIDNRLEIPLKGSEEFNPNITYYQVVYPEGEEVDDDTYILYTYIYDKDKERYLRKTSTNNIPCISSVEITTEGKLMAYYYDGTSIDVGSVVSNNSLFTAIKIGNALFTDIDKENNAIILPEFVTAEYVADQLSTLEDIYIKRDEVDLATKEYVHEYVQTWIAQLESGGSVDFDTLVKRSDLDAYLTKDAFAENLATELKATVLCGGDADPTDDNL
jgi:hypothetical protein